MEFKNPFTNARVVRENCPNEVYLASRGKRGDRDYVMSRSEMMRVRGCPQKWLRGIPEKSTDATDFGSLVDCLLLQPNEFEKRFIVRPETYPDGKTGEQKKWTMAANFCKDWVAKNAAGKTVIAPEDFQGAEKALDRLFEDPSTEQLLDGARVQVLVMADYHDKQSGLLIPVKGLIDIVPSKAPFATSLCDLKTALSASPSKWPRAVYEHGYQVQAALYVDLWNAATGEGRDTFLHLIVENEEPYEPGRRVLSQEFVELGRMSYLNALEIYCQCLSTGVWPGYDSADRCLPTLPAWSLSNPETWMVSAYA